MGRPIYTNEKTRDIQAVSAFERNHQSTSHRQVSELYPKLQGSGYLFHHLPPAINLVSEKPEARILLIVFSVHGDSNRRWPYL